jgi:hypothetical protein
MTRECATASPVRFGANLGNDLGAEAIRHGQQAGRDRMDAFDGDGLWAEDLAPKALARIERRRLLRATDCVEASIRARAARTSSSATMR